MENFMYPEVARSNKSETEYIDKIYEENSNT